MILNMNEVVILGEGIFMEFWLIGKILISKVNERVQEVHYNAWRIPWTEEPGGLWSIASKRVGHK